MLDALTASFGSFDNFKAKFAETTINTFGSGWGWLVKNADGTLASNQALPSLPTGASPGGDAVLLESAVRLQLDATGTPLGPAVVVP